MTQAASSSLSITTSSHILDLELKINVPWIAHAPFVCEMIFKLKDDLTIRCFRSHQSDLSICRAGMTKRCLFPACVSRIIDTNISDKTDVRNKCCVSVLEINSRLGINRESHIDGWPVPCSPGIRWTRFHLSARTCQEATNYSRLLSIRSFARFNWRVCTYIHTHLARVCSESSYMI